MEPTSIPTHERTEPGLEHCAGCGRDFVVPVALLDFVDDGLYLLAMRCTNCERLTVGIEEDAALEQLERTTRDATMEMESALDLVRIAGFIDDVDLFGRALRAGAVLPEDF